MAEEATHAMPGRAPSRSEIRTDPLARVRAFFRLRPAKSAEPEPSVVTPPPSLRERRWECPNCHCVRYGTTGRVQRECPRCERLAGEAGRWRAAGLQVPPEVREAAALSRTVALETIPLLPAERSLLLDLFDVFRLYGVEPVPGPEATLYVVGRKRPRWLVVRTAPLAVELVHVADAREPCRRLRLDRPRPQILSEVADHLVGMVQTPVAAETLLRVARGLGLQETWVDGRWVELGDGRNGRRISFEFSGGVERIELRGEWDEGAGGVLPHPGSLDRDEKLLLDQRGSEDEVLRGFAGFARQ